MDKKLQEISHDKYGYCWSRLLEIFSGHLLKVFLMAFVMGVWVYTKDLCPPNDFGLYSMDFSMISSKNWVTIVIQRPWPNVFWYKHALNWGFRTNRWFHPLHFTDNSFDTTSTACFHDIDIAKLFAWGPALGNTWKCFWLILWGDWLKASLQLLVGSLKPLSNFTQIDTHVLEEP